MASNFVFVTVQASIAANTSFKRGKYLTVGNPIKLSDSPTTVKRSPLLGEHTDEVLAELGYSPQEINGFRANKAI